MAGVTGIASGLEALASPLSQTSDQLISTASTKNFHELSQEVNQIKSDIETKTKVWDKIDVGKKKAAENHDRCVQGRIDIRNLLGRVNQLQQDIQSITKEMDPTRTPKVFEKNKRDALKTLSNMSSKLNNSDKHLEKLAKTIPVVPATENPTETNPLVVDHSKSIAALVGHPSSNDPVETETSSILAVSTAQTKSKTKASTADYIDKNDDDQLSNVSDHSRDDDNDVIDVPQQSSN
jgi:hypothetical protein